MLAAPPPDEYALLELAVDWDGLVGVDAQLAAALRLFVITRDPLDWLRHRGSAWATANSDGDTLEIPVYVARDELERRVEENGRDLSEAIGPLAESGVLAASSCQGIIFAGAYPELAIRGEAPACSERSSTPGGWSTGGRRAIHGLGADRTGRDSGPGPRCVWTSQPGSVGGGAAEGQPTEARVPGLHGRSLRIPR